MPKLTACAKCGRHSIRGETCCPHCGNCTRGLTASAALVGLALAASGCDSPEPEDMDVEPAYGVVAMDSGGPEDTGDTAD